MNRPKSLGPHASADNKREYERPTLTIFGPLAQLTQGGPSGVMEGIFMLLMSRKA